jgi:glycosyltransferase involved in cell wall biosynthesis
MENDKLVSIYITTKNRCKMLNRAVESVLKQSYEYYEIIISDDGSTDDTEIYCLNLIEKNKKVKYIRSVNSNGACIARNKAIAIASGEYITGLDDDDEFTVDRLSEFVSNWNPKYSFICANFFDSNDGKLSRYYWGLRDREFNLDDILLSNVASNQVFTLTERLKTIGGFSEDVKKFQDWDTWIRLCSKYGAFLRLSLPTYILHHEHENPKQRVSNAITFAEALAGIYQRNMGMYDYKRTCVMKSKISSRNKKYLIIDVIKDTLNYPSIMFFIRYTVQFLRK